MVHLSIMKLESYLKKHGISVPSFATRICVTKGLIYAYIRGDKLPSPERMKAIAIETNNEVLPNDWCDVKVNLVHRPKRKPAIVNAISP